MSQTSTTVKKPKRDLVVIQSALDTVLSGFDNDLIHYIESAWAPEQDLQHLEALENYAYELAARVIEIGDLCTEALDQGEEISSYYGICYLWMEDAKSFLILWRNTLFEEQKALVLVSEGKAKMDQYLALKTNAKATLLEAAKEINTSLQHKLKTSGSTAKKLISRLSLQNNPWPNIYRAQIASLPPQCEALVRQFKHLWNASGVYVLVKSGFQEAFDNHKIALENFKQGILQINSSLEFTEELVVADVVKQLSNLNEEHLSSRSFQDMQKELDSDLKGLPKSGRYVIQLVGNKLSFEEMDLRHRTRAWLDSEVLPLMNNFYAIRANIKNQFNLSLSNIKNRLNQENEEGEKYEKEELLSALNTFVKRLEKSEQQIAQMRKEVIQQFGAMNVHKIYDGNFLNLSIASTLNQYNANNKERFEGLKKWVQNKGIFVKRFQDSVEEEERLSLSEKLVRVINARKPTEGSSHYTNMFMTKGYIGSSFMVGRQEELKHIANIVDNWKLGYRGSVMITGIRFSGKTLLAEITAQTHFPDKTIKLTAGKRLQVGGRHIDATYSLGAQLEFVEKYSLQDKVLVMIDDLQQWNNEEFSLLQNVRAMAKVIDKHSNKIFFVVCLNNWLKERLQSALNLESIFQAEINTDTLSFEEIKRAILIRHSATHAELVNDDGEELNNKSVNKIIKHINYETKGNVGESFMRWAHDIHMYDDDKVQYTYSDHVLPQFLNSSSSILLITIITYGASNEYLLKRLFGPSFQEEYKPILQRLINVGVIQRTINGRLEIRPSIVNDIAALLEKYTSFTYLKKTNIN